MSKNRPRESWLRKFLRKRREQRLFATSSTRNVFDWIYRTNKWGDADSASGSGSNLTQTRALREALPGLLERLGVKTLFDAPCGDFHWMQHTPLQLTEYIGADIVQALVDYNNDRHAAPGRSFLCLDLAEDPLPSADAILCRDCLVHLDFATSARVIENIKRSGYRYLLTTSHGLSQRNVDKLTGKHRLLNLALPPYGWPPPIEQIVEDFPAGEDTGKILGVWRVEDIGPPGVG